MSRMNGTDVKRHVAYSPAITELRRLYGLALAGNRRQSPPGTQSEATPAPDDLSFPKLAERESAQPAPAGVPARSGASELDE